MLELGVDERQMHEDAGREIAESGVEVLWGVRGLAADILKGANAAGLHETRFFDSSEDAAVAVLSEARRGDLLLIKGSRGVATDKIVKALKEHFVLTESEA